MSQLICLDCGKIGFPKTVTKGSILIELVLWICFIVPGIIYSIWRLTTRGKACRSCGAGNLVPFDSPRGKELQGERSCPACREKIRFDARVCRHCGLQYPYLAEPARTHIVAIADLHREGRTAPEIIASLDGRGIRPALGSTWTIEMISTILRDHVA